MQEGSQQVTFLLTPEKTHYNTKMKINDIIKALAESDLTVADVLEAVQVYEDFIAVAGKLVAAGVKITIGEK